MDENKLDQYIANFLNGKKLTGEETRADYIGQEGKRLAEDLKILYGQDEQINIALYAYYKELLVWATNNGVTSSYDLATILKEGTSLINRHFPSSPKGPEDLSKMIVDMPNGVQDVKFQNMIENAIHIMTQQMDANSWKDYINYVDYFNDHWVNQMENYNFDITLPLEENIEKGEYAMPIMSDDELIETYNNEFLIKQREELTNLLVGENAAIQYAGGKYNGLIAVKNTYGTYDLYEPKPRYYTDYTDPDNLVEDVFVEIESLSYSVDPGEPDENFPRFTNLTAREIYHEPMNRRERLRWNKQNKLRPGNTAFGSTSSDDDVLSRRIKQLEEDLKAVENVLRTAGLSQEEIKVANDKINQLTDEIEELSRLQTSQGERRTPTVAAEPDLGEDVLDAFDEYELELVQNTELEKKTAKFEQMLLNKYKEYIADKPQDTEPFRNMPEGSQPLEISIIDDKFLYVDLVTIKPEMQGQQGGSMIMGEIVRYADENNLHVISVPVNDTVQRSMRKYGGRQLLSGYHYFGWKLEEAQAAEDEVFQVQIDRFRNEFTQYTTEINALNNEEYKALIATAESSGDSKLVNLFKEIKEGLTFEDFRMGMAENKYHTYEINPQDTPTPGLARGGSPNKDLIDFFEEMNKEAKSIQLDSYTNFDELSGRPSQAGTFFHWVTNTKVGTMYLWHMLHRMDEKNITATATQIKQQIEKDLQSFMDANSPGQGGQNMISNPQAQAYLNAGKQDTPMILKDIDFKEVTNREANWLASKIGTPELRNSLSYEMLWVDSTIEDLKDAGVINYRFPTQLDFNADGNLVIYRAMTPIDAALGIRAYQPYRQSGFSGRVAGYGSVSYASSNANYPYEYISSVGMNRQVFALEITDITPDNILNMQAPVVIYPEIMDALSIPYTDKLAMKSVDYLLHSKNLLVDKGYIPANFDMGRFKKDLPLLGNFKIVLNPHTGPGRTKQITYLDNTGAVQTYGVSDSGQWKDSRRKIFDEVLIVDDSVGVRIQGIVDTRRPDDEIGPKDIKPFDANKAVQNEIDNIVKNISSEAYPNFLVMDTVIGRVEDLKRELTNEITNRKNSILEQQLGLFTAGSPFDPELDIEQLNKHINEELNVLLQNLRAFRNKNPKASYEELTKEINFNLENQTEYLTPGVYNPKYSEYTIIQPGSVLGGAPVIDRNIYIKESITLPNGNIGYKLWKLIDMEMQSMILIDEFANTKNALPSSRYEVAYIPEDKLDYYNSLYDEFNNIQTGKVLNPILGASIQGVMREDILLNPTLKHLLNETGNVIELGLVHSSPYVPVSINEFTSGALSPRVPVVDPTTGDVKFINVGGDGRNKQLLVGMSASFENNIIKYEANKITGKSTRGVPNYFLTRLNSNNVLTQANVINGSWLNKFSIVDAAASLDVSPVEVYKALEETGLISLSDTGGYYGTSFSQRGSRQFLESMEKVYNRIIGVPPLNSDGVGLTRFLRSGGIDAIIDNPNINFRNFQELMILDPNDQSQIGRALDIIDITEDDFKELNGSYRVVDPDTEPLRNYEDINTNLRQTALDEAYDVRINFEQGFRNAELEAMGLLSDEAIEEIRHSSIIPSQAVELVKAGQQTPIPTQFIEDVTEASRIITAIAEDEYYQTLGKIDALRKSGVEGTEQVLEMITYHNQASSKWRAIQASKNKLAYSFGKRGVRPTGFMLLDIYELSLWGGALAYGTSDKWTVWFENIVKDISNNVLNTNYTLDEPGQIDYEKLDNTIKFAEKIDPFNILVGPMIDDIKGVKELYPSSVDDYVTRGLTDTERITMPGYEYAPGYKTSDRTIAEYSPAFAEINASEISQGKPINRFGAFFQNQTAKYKDNKDNDKSKYYNTYSSNYLNLYEDEPMDVDF